VRQGYTFNVERLTLNVSFSLILSGLVIYYSAPPRLLAAPPAQSPDKHPSISGGRTLWAENCQPCHGSTGKGDGPATQNIPDPLPDFSKPEIAWQHVPTENFDVIKNGRIEKLMPPWGNRLTDAQIWDLTAYVWSLSVKPEELAAGEAIYAEQCGACHGSGGTGDGPKASAQMVSFTDLLVMGQRSQADLQANFKASKAHAQLNPLSEQKLRQSLNYIRTFTFKLPQRNGVLKGQVINATTNKPQGNIEVTLRVFEGNTEVEKKTAQADSAGNYTFEKLPTDHTILYAVEGRYKDVTYFSDEPGLFTPDSSETALNLNVYETTTSAEAINITQLHYLMSFTPNAVNVVQIFVVGNHGNQTYVGSKDQTFTFSLPENAQNVKFENDETGARFIETEGSYADTEPITPGEESLSIVAMYEVPYDDTLTIKVPLPDDVTSANILMQDQGAQLSSEQLQFVETRQFQGNSFSIFNAADLKKGQELILKLTDLNKLTFTGETAAPGAVVPTGGIDQNLLRWIVIGLGGAVIVFVAVGYPYFRPQLTHQPGGYLEDPNLRKQKLLLILARLDGVFEAGELDKQLYHRARAKYKAELVKLMEE
jgi:mono/diheme cytochrome c family protein